MTLPKKIIYPAVFSYDDDGICVYFPDVDGCYSQGDSTEEALYMAKDALESVSYTHLDVYKRQGKRRLL